MIGWVVRMVQEISGASLRRVTSMVRLFPGCVLGARVTTQSEETIGLLE
jgi:hypothetical protein